jgi:hypothetical protein
MQSTETSSVVEAEPKSKAELKSQIVKRLLLRRAGATLYELTAATTWQPHSVRAFLSGLRKTGATILREDRRNGEKAYCLPKPGTAAGGK